jgi:hypothetical protein
MIGFLCWFGITLAKAKMPFENTNVILVFGNRHANVIFSLKKGYREWTSKVNFDSMVFDNVEFACRFVFQLFYSFCLLIISATKWSHGGPRVETSVIQVSKGFVIYITGLIRITFQR